MQSQESTPVQSMHGPSPSAGMPWEGQDGLTQEEKGRGIWRRTRPCYSQGAKEEAAETETKKRPRSPTASLTNEQREDIKKGRRPTSPPKTEPESQPSAPSTAQQKEQPEENQETKPDDKLTVDAHPPRTYGYWMHSKQNPRSKPWALILFSGKSREGDIQRNL